MPNEPSFRFYTIPPATICPMCHSFMMMMVDGPDKYAAIGATGTFLASCQNAKCLDYQTVYRIESPKVIATYA